MSKTKEEYMELAYKDGLAGFFAQLNEQGTSIYGKFDGTVTKQTPECAITQYMVHETPLTLTLNMYEPYGINDSKLPLNPVFPAGLEAEDLFNAMIKIQLWKEQEDHSLAPISTSFTRAMGVEILSLKLDAVDPIIVNLFAVTGTASALYDRTTGVLLLETQMMSPFNTALKTYLDSLSPDDPK
jgi:hypothetical protein